jgi:hypothetical protein
MLEDKNNEKVILIKRITTTPNGNSPLIGSLFIRRKNK